MSERRIILERNDASRDQAVFTTSTEFDAMKVELYGGAIIVSREEAKRLQAWLNDEAFKP
jgi:hypothetical protein